MQLELFCAKYQLIIEILISPDFVITITLSIDKSYILFDICPQSTLN